MRFPSVYLSLLCGLAASHVVLAQGNLAEEIKGTWYFHQYYFDSTLFADADVPLPIPWDAYAAMKQAAASQGVPVPDSVAFAEQIRHINESYRQYHLIVAPDGSYTTFLAAGMTKWLPTTGQLVVNDAGDVQFFDVNGNLITKQVLASNDRLLLELNGPAPCALHFRRAKP